MNPARIHASREWRDGHVVDTDVTMDELPGACADPNTLVWVDLVRPTAEDLAAFTEPLHLGAAAIEDALADHERPKFTRHDSHAFFTVYSARLAGRAAVEDDHGQLATSRISGFVLPHALLTIRLDDEFDMTPVIAAWDDSPHLLQHGSAALVHGLLDVVVDGHFETIQQLDDQIEGLEDELFAEHRTGHTFLHQTYGVRKDLVALRRVVLPMREVVNGILRHRTAERSELDVWFDDLYDHVLRAAEWTESLRDMVTTVFETNLSLQDSRLNQVMKKLAGWAAIIAVPTAITGWFGQNVPYLGFQQGYGVWLSLGMIIGVSALLYVLFRNRDWI